LRITAITSNANALLKKVRGLHERGDREKTGLFLLEGKKLLHEALSKDLKIEDVIVSQSYFQKGLSLSLTDDIEAINLVDDNLFKPLCTTTTPSGIIAVAQIPSKPLPDKAAKSALFVIGVAIQDPGNLGTLIRTAYAANAHAILLTKGTVDPYNPKVVRSAMGALFDMPVAKELSFNQAIDLCKKANCRVVALDANAAKPYWDIDLAGPVAIAVGNEGSGFTESDLALVDEVVSIPMNPSAESLNAAMAAGIVLFGCVQARAKNKPG
jgi:TrmH family RNA methyltransferase